MSWRYKCRVELAGLERPGSPGCYSRAPGPEAEEPVGAWYKFFNKFCLPSEISSGSALLLG
jgi:hypothetical protein